MKSDLELLNLPIESIQGLEIVLHSLGTFFDVYKNMGTTTNTIVDFLRKRKQMVMGPDKWPEVEKKVSKQQAISLFNFKEGPKWSILKVQYLKHPHITDHLYDHFLEAYLRFP